MNIKAMDKRYLMRSSPAEDLVVARARGSLVFDNRGRRYVDFTAGWCVGNLGWDRPSIRRKLRSARSATYVHPDHLYRPWVELAELLARITPGRLKRSFRATGGTEAVDIALQVAMLATRRRKFVSLEGSYHGNSIGTVSIASSDGRKAYPNLLSGGHTVGPPLDDRALGKVETLLRRRDVAAFVMEPISCNLGVLIPEPGFMEGLQRLCRRYGTLLVMDEVACGFGRTGALFASEHFDIEPDILCLGKAITGGHAALGATVVTDAVADALGDEWSFWSTYGWHPLSVEAALAAVREMVRHRGLFLGHVQAMSRYFEDRLRQTAFRSKATIRVKGLAIGVELDKKGYADGIQEKSRKAGLLVSGEEGTLSLFPALTIDRATAAEGLDILESCL